MHERLQLGLIETTARADTAAKVHAPWLDLVDGVSDVFRSKSSCQKDRRAHFSPDLRAQAPVVGPARSSELFRAELLVARIEQERVDMRGNVDCFLHGLPAGNVNHLNDGDAWHRGAELVVTALDQTIAKLDGIRAAPLLLRNDVTHPLMAREKKRRDGRRYRASDRLYQILRNDTRPAWHRGHEPDSVSARFDRDPCLFDATDATHLYTHANKMNGTCDPGAEYPMFRREGQLAEPQSTDSGFKTVRASRDVFRFRRVSSTPA